MLTRDQFKSILIEKVWLSQGMAEFRDAFRQSFPERDIAEELFRIYERHCTPDELHKLAEWMQHPTASLYFEKMPNMLGDIFKWQVATADSFKELPASKSTKAAALERKARAANKRS